MQHVSLCYDQILNSSVARTNSLVIWSVDQMASGQDKFQPSDLNFVPNPPLNTVHDRDVPVMIGATQPYYVRDLVCTAIIVVLLQYNMYRAAARCFGRRRRFRDNVIGYIVWRALKRKKIVCAPPGLLEMSRGLVIEPIDERVRCTRARVRVKRDVITSRNRYRNVIVVYLRPLCNGLRRRRQQRRRRRRREDGVNYHTWRFPNDRSATLAISWSSDTGNPLMCATSRRWHDNERGGLLVSSAAHYGDRLGRFFFLSLSVRCSAETHNAVHTAVTPFSFRIKYLPPPFTRSSHNTPVLMNAVVFSEALFLYFPVPCPILLLYLAPTTLLLSAGIELAYLTTPTA